jgi:hypothetical protein
LGYTVEINLAICQAFTTFAKDMAKTSVKILREFYREQDKGVVKTLNPDDDTQSLIKILSVPNPIKSIAKRKKLSFTTVVGDLIVEVNPDGTHTTIGTISSKDIPVTKRTISLL